MGWKCAPQVMGLVRGEPKPGQKHRMSGEKMAKEAGYERASKSSTFDRKRSHLNVYEGYKSGKKFWEDLAAEADAYKAKVHTKTKDGKEVIRERKLRQDAVIGFAMIFNPPAEVCMGWSDAEYAKFYSDAEACMEEIEPRIFRKKNIRMKAEHFDEGIPPEEGIPEEELKGVISRHIHELGICVDKDGNYCGNLIDAKLMIRINEQFPRLMRERGWKDMEDMDTTDWKKAKVDKAYAQERNAKRRNSGRTVNAHIAQKLNKKLQEVDSMMASAEELKTSAEKLNSDAEEAVKNAEWDAKIIKSNANSQAKQIISKAQTEAQTKIDEGEKEYKKKVKKADSDIAQMKQATEEAAEAYSDMLFNWLAILRAKNNRQHIVDNFEYLVEVQEAIEKEFQIREDAIDAQAKAAADDAVQKATADLERMKKQMALSRKAFEHAKRQVESEIDNDVKRDFRKEMQFSMELMNILQATDNQRVKTAAKIVQDFVRPEQEEIVKAYEIVKKQNAEQMKEHIQSIADDLENQIARGGDQYE